ncbi:MAG TPA: OmpA family protein, partial [Labilithrix sp.]|nr:OmpA family protein [Labilithrix sp.]
QSREFGFGAAGSVALELPVGRSFGFEVKLSALVLSKGDPPRDVSFARPGTGTAFVGSGGVRVRPFTEVAGPWASAGLGFAQTGSRSRLGIDAMLGWDFRLGQGRWDIGPYVGFQQLVEPEDSLRPEDARVMSVGIHVGFGVPRRAPKVQDRDADGIVDREDACPDVAGVRTNDPKTNGCPRSDRDQDTVFDDEDACPDVPGVRTDDPKTNGCPRSDRDQDTVFDDEDACPDVPGLPTSDPKTNGCPAETHVYLDSERIHLDDQILFDLDSPRVRHASWAGVKRLATFINANPAIREVTIEGHADATGTEEHNLVLSRDRAEAVKRLLVRYGVAADRLKSEAYGRSRLRVQTEGPERKNRRVEFWVTRAQVVEGVEPPKPHRGGK